MKKTQTTGNLKTLVSEKYRIQEEDLDMVSGGKRKSASKSPKTKKFKEKRKDHGDAVRGFLRFLIGD